MLRGNGVHGKHDWDEPHGACLMYNSDRSTLWQVSKMASALLRAAKGTGSALGWGPTGIFPLSFRFRMRGIGYQAKGLGMCMVQCCKVQHEATRIENQSSFAYTKSIALRRVMFVCRVATVSYGIAFAITFGPHQASLCQRLNSSTGQQATASICRQRKGTPRLTLARGEGRDQIMGRRAHSVPNTAKNHECDAAP